MTRRPDGRFNVRCDDGRQEVATVEDIARNRVCDPVIRPIDDIDTVNPRPDGRFDVVCTNGRHLLVTQLELFTPGLCAGPRGQWHPAEGQDCADFCRGIGERNIPSPEGHLCTSGELIPESAVGVISYKKGCWPNCSPHGAPNGRSHRNMCYGDGQKKDNDRTDRTMGCYCGR